MGCWCKLVKILGWERQEGTKRRERKRLGTDIVAATARRGLSGRGEGVDYIRRTGESQTSADSKAGTRNWGSHHMVIF